MFSTFERIKSLAKSRGYSISKLEENLGLSKNAIYAIKRNQPSAERLQEIANYFNVSTDYLLGRTDNPRIATDKDVQEIDFKEMAAESMSYDGMPLNDEDIDLIASILETRMKNRDKE
ncbi:helix-turn-helix transcriptional regulator [Streptococcus suis]|uniref:helix-turn-helix domain-containing protein n=1 Tax=Streptococcus suis TaxID=1307 RepID=UPI001554D79C|nr:helix-turn-helix transcriptional regulator [Streptococcus suis]NQJ61202.1 helix-turn-helix transcriptional regulator [Streptococcus suis]NQJ65143.1 helix-turn-helix transcriptional regulator [Streptococcus suis]UUM45893.1 helix-turn-helix transcriptional regulator [Streptococcus suis]HEL2551261.1 helix-turn-helix transcriptional regulator [Streptococcus suis]HEM4497496.1 helix-turn-helix transcriptional regulator [Streptococcus suis]